MVEELLGQVCVVLGNDCCHDDRTRAGQENLPEPLNHLRRLQLRYQLLSSVSSAKVTMAVTMTESLRETGWMLVMAQHRWYL
ncbi:hypothetical protein AGABI1DRAFT_97397 [Agaricus bisporus var. burnettii JB137-S8]|uniref:Uncharacterized protein n=1 Tax=Agaricus bisporus var. burnettii (strain JB137-S8 / ATCC MYA-4627 / FGSC 10392) TaxID=597362 RepID=K5XGK2_AGABU|nr:uncharacterized protein AGABI1DRAFT_97397 [Agaricus bisporus var. burnettii JB137-S8]EKM82397.1 hypothetical protein AGABI1DRAFT_97397 [Agaricus bisporus var. burnettii JB137-S8]